MNKILANSKDCCLVYTLLRLEQVWSEYSVIFNFHHAIHCLGNLDKTLLFENEPCVWTWVMAKWKRCIDSLDFRTLGIAGRSCVEWCHFFWLLFLLSCLSHSPGDSSLLHSIASVAFIHWPSLLSSALFSRCFHFPLSTIVPFLSILCSRFAFPSSLTASSQFVLLSAALRGWS